MAHLHLPDGILPIWLVLSGWILILPLLAVALRRTHRLELRGRLPRLGFVAALMILVMGAEILPLAYHLDLSVLAGILLGPAFGILAAFIVEFMLALLGHGGLTVLGLNTLVLTAEMILGSTLFRILVRKGFSQDHAAWLATLCALSVSTSLMVGIVWLARLDPARLGEHAAPSNFREFLGLTYGLGSIGWLLEASVTAGIIRSLGRLRPGILAES